MAANFCNPSRLALSLSNEPATSTTLTFAIGRNTFDNCPETRSVATFREFADEVLGPPFSNAKGLRYVSAAFSNDGRRCKDNVQPRAWLPFDFDGIADQATFANLYMFLSQWSGFAYTTASHTPEAPRARGILEASRPMDRGECQRVCMAIEVRILAHLGEGVVKFDTSVYRGEQPCFTPVAGAEIQRWTEGDAVDVDLMLREAPALAERPSTRERLDGIASTDPVLHALNDRGMVKGQRTDGAFNVECPCANEHTSESNESSTVYHLPMTGGVKYGRFHCLHAHCDGRDNNEYLKALGLDPTRVYAEQSGISGGALDFANQYMARQQLNSGSRYCVPTLQPLTMEGIRAARLTPRTIAEGYLWADLAVLAAPGGTGKTTIVLCEAVNLALGRSIWGHYVPEPASTLFVTAEDSSERLQARLFKVMEGMSLSEYDMRKVISRITIWDVTGEMLRLAEIGKGGNIELTPLADEIVKAFQGRHLGVVNFDPTVSFGPGERMVNDAEQSLVTAARRIIKGMNCCVRLIHHTGQNAAQTKSTDQYAVRGGSALPDGARMVFILQPENKPQGVTLHPGETCLRMAMPKCSYARQKGDWFIIRDHWTFRCGRQPTEAERASEVRGELDADINNLVQFIRDERASDRYYGKADLDHQSPLGWTRARMRQVLSAAQTRRMLTTETEPKPNGAGRPREILIPADDTRRGYTETPGDGQLSDEGGKSPNYLSPLIDSKYGGGNKSPPVTASVLSAGEATAGNGENGEKLPNEAELDEAEPDIVEVRI